MGSFSWLKADNLTNIRNVAYGEPFKFLIPKEFGGGYIQDNYQDYGYLGKKEDGEPKYDMYELLAFWNADQVGRIKCTWNPVTYEKKWVIDADFGVVKNHLKWDGKFNGMKEIDEYTDGNRDIGIDIGCYDEQISILKYPLKLVSIEYNGSYEDCDGRSYGDPDQGFEPVRRDQKRRWS